MTSSSAGGVNLAIYAFTTYVINSPVAVINASVVGPAKPESPKKQ